ncbi:MAG: hypothetical protein J6S23_08780, partial [Clostridia bacterium]|nr:hypothetical protein [Clostridia bacterium]
MTKKTKTRNKIGFSEAFSIVASVFLFALLMKNSRLVSIETASALKICATLLIPSLFPLTVASELATATGAIEKITSGIKGVISRLLGIKKSAAAPYFLGVLGGYTSSCKSAVTLFENGKITEDDCEGVIAISNMPSLAFLTSFVGAEILNSTTDGWILWGITVFSTFVLGLFNRFFNKNHSTVSVGQVQFHTTNSNKKISRIVVDAVSHSAQAMLVICGFVVFFSVLIRVLDLTLLHFNTPSETRRFLLGALEITHGVTSCKEIQNELIKRVLCAFFIGW